MKEGGNMNDRVTLILKVEHYDKVIGNCPREVVSVTRDKNEISVNGSCVSKMELDKSGECLNLS